MAEKILINMEYQFDSKAYKQKIGTGKVGGSVLVYIFVCIILMGAIFFLQPKAKTNYDAFYAVEVNNFLNYSSAGELANEIQSRGGAGFVYFDGKYHVFASLYFEKGDAQSVLKNLKAEYPTSKIFEFEFNKKIKLNNLNDAQKAAAKNLVDNGDETLKQIYGNILAFDKLEIEKNELILNFKTIRNRFLDYADAFNAAFSENSKFNKAKSQIAELDLALSNLIDSADYSYKLKYELFRFAISYTNILSCF